MNYYTTIEQSKKLLELGLNPKTSDCNWQHAPGYENYEGKITGFWDDPEWGQSGDSKDLPCWSLGALLDVMPKIIYKEHDMFGWDLYPTNKNIRLAYIKYGNVNTPDYQEIVFHEINEKTPIEAIYSMVVWLLENEYIKTEKK